MHLIPSRIEQSAYGNRWRTRHPAERLALAIGMLVLSIALPPLPAGAAIAPIMALIALSVVRIPFSTYLRTLAVPLGFAVAGAGATLVSLSVDGGGVRITPAPGGPLLAAGLLVRSLAATSCLCFLLLTTPIAEIVSLLRRGGVPAAVCELMLAIYRFIHLFAETAAAIRLAQTARCGYSSRRNAYRSISRLAASLLVRSFERARRLEIGISARGYEGDVRWLEPARTLSVKALAGIAILECGIVILSRSCGGGWQP